MNKKIFVQRQSLIALLQPASTPAVRQKTYLSRLSWGVWCRFTKAVNGLPVGEYLRSLGLLVLLSNKRSSIGYYLKWGRGLWRSPSPVTKEG